MIMNVRGICTLCITPHPISIGNACCRLDKQAPNGDDPKAGSFDEPGAAGPEFPLGMCLCNQGRHFKVSRNRPIRTNDGCVSMVMASSGSRDNEQMIWNAQPYDPRQDRPKSRVCLGTAQPRY